MTCSVVLHELVFSSWTDPCPAIMAMRPWLAGMAMMEEKHMGNIFTRWHGQRISAMYMGAFHASSATPLLCYLLMFLECALPSV